MIKGVVIFLCSCLSVMAASWSVTQSGAGSQDGSSEANAKPLSWFNDSASWGVGGIVPGDTVSFYGELTNSAGSSVVAVKGSGTSENRINIRLESNATVKAPHFGVLGGVSCVTNSNINIQGFGASIYCTDNGSGLGYSNTTYGVYVAGCTNVAVSGIVVTNIYRNAGSINTATDLGGASTAGIKVSGNNKNITVESNFVYASRTGILVSFDASSISDITISSNIIADHCWGICVGSGTAGATTTNIIIRGNTITGWDNWQYPIANYHTDGIIAYTANESSLFEPKIYNNYIYGDLGGGSPTAFIYVTYGTTPNDSTRAIIYNNLLVFTNRPFWAISTGTYTTNNQIYHNTIIANTNNASLPFVVTGGNTKIKNNLIYGYLRMIGSYGDVTNLVTECDGNLWMNVKNLPSGNVVYNGSAVFYSYAQWRSFGFDASSLTNIVALTSDYKPSSVSINPGVNLSDVPDVLLDRDGVYRKNWFPGAYDGRQRSIPLKWPKP